MGCKQSRQNVVKVDKDVEVRRKLQLGLHLAKDEAGVQFALGKTSRKKNGPSVQHQQEEDVVGEPSEVRTLPPTETERSEAPEGIE